jgi:hypothetical protein
MGLAAFSLMKQTGASPGTEANTNWDVGLINDDSNSTDTGAYPIPVPETGYSYSYESWLRLKCTAAPDNAVANLKVWFAATSPATGVSLMIGTTASYATPTNEASTVATVNATQYPDAGSALAIGTPQSYDEISAINEYSDYIIVQLRVGPTAGQGNLPVQVLHVRYDES